MIKESKYSKSSFVTYIDKLWYIGKKFFLCINLIFVQTKKDSKYLKSLFDTLKERVNS